jgi:hypothetical protein
LARSATAVLAFVLPPPRKERLNAKDESVPQTRSAL